MLRTLPHIMAPLPLTILLILALTLGCSRRDRENRSEPSTSAQGAPTPRPPAPNYILVDGKDILRLGRAEGGKGFLVNLWASWCGPCKREFPMLLGLRESYKEAGIHLLLVSVDEEATREDAVRFAAEQGILDTIFVAKPPLEALKKALNPRWPGMLPASFLYDTRGELRYFFGGPVYENELSPMVLGLARGEAISGEAIFGLAPGMDARGSAEPLQ